MSRKLLLLLSICVTGSGCVCWHKDKCSHKHKHHGHHCDQCCSCIPAAPLYPGDTFAGGCTSCSSCATAYPVGMPMQQGVVSDCSCSAPTTVMHAPMQMSPVPVPPAAGNSPGGNSAPDGARTYEGTADPSASDVRYFKGDVAPLPPTDKIAVEQMSYTQQQPGGMLFVPMETELVNPHQQ